MPQFDLYKSRINMDGEIRREHQNIVNYFTLILSSNTHLRCFSFLNKTAPGLLATHPQVKFESAHNYHHSKFPNPHWTH